VAPKWPGDAGGAPALVDGKVWVIEGFRFPADFDQEQIPVFNTNTFTVNADALTKDYELTPCYVRKTVEGRDAVQFETLVGELTRFLSSQYAKVNRAGKSSRFFPIKTPQDLADGQEDLRLICG
jgi:UTP--glucose-1-phosphate uridylyltransferase